MAELNFPYPASVDQLYTGTNLVTYIYDGLKWKVYGLTVGSGSGGGGTLGKITDLITTVTNATSLQFDTNSGLIVTNLGLGIAQISINQALLTPDSYKSIEVQGYPTLTASGKDTLKFIAGQGISIRSDDTAGKSITVENTILTPIKTFNVLNQFSAPLMGKAVFVPNNPDTIRTVQLTNGQNVGMDLMVGLYRNNALLQFFTIPAGYQTYTYTDLSYVINKNDYLTVNVVAGSGINFSLALYNI